MTTRPRTSIHQAVTRGSLLAYRPVPVDTRTVYIRNDVWTQLREIEAVIFDCDGVLIDTRRSYNATIVRTARFILRQLLGFALPQGIITQSVIQALRHSGGFNNDWDSTYVITLYLFSRLPQSVHDRFRRPSAGAHGGLSLSDVAVTQFSDGDQLRKLKQQIQAPDSVGRMRAGLSQFARQADSSGIGSLDKILFQARQPASRLQALRSLKAVLGYPAHAGHSLLANIFDEIFYGPTLFVRVHGCHPRYYVGAGAIERETLIVTESTMKQLTELVGRQNLGIASGRGTIATEHTLDHLMEYFNPRALVLLEDQELTAQGNIEKLRAERAKPAPYSLLTSAAAMKNFKRALYVGDSAEDLIMVRRALEEDPRYLFAAVTGHGFDPPGKRRFFGAEMADLILPTVNQLPSLLDMFCTLGR